MNTIDQIHAKLIHAVTEYDRRQQRTRFYNPHALGQYFKRVDEVCADMRKGMEPRQAILRGFNGRLCDKLCKAIGAEIQTKDEARSGSWAYSPSN